VYGIRNRSLSPGRLSSPSWLSLALLSFWYVYFELPVALFAILICFPAIIYFGACCEAVGAAARPAGVLGVSSYASYVIHLQLHESNLSRFKQKRGGDDTVGRNRFRCFVFWIGSFARAFPTPAGIRIPVFGRAHYARRLG
jgi:hypothetical protein